MNNKKKVQDLHKEVRLTKKVLNDKNGRIDTKWARLTKKGRIDTRC